MTTVAPWWVRVEGSNLAQGDYLPKCLIPFFEPDYGTGEGIQEVPVKEYNCIVLTQSCDLENDKAPLVALCPIFPISAYKLTPASNKRARGRECGREGSKDCISWHRMMAHVTIVVVL